MEQHLQILNRNSVYARKLTTRDLWNFYFRWSISETVRSQFSDIHRDHRSGKQESNYEYDSEGSALAAAAELQDSMEAERQIKYAHRHGCLVSALFPFNFVTILSDQYNRI